MKYLALIMLVSSIFAGSASAHRMVPYSYCWGPTCPGGLILDKDKVQNMMHYYPMHQYMHYHMMYIH